MRICKTCEYYKGDWHSTCYKGYSTMCNRDFCTGYENKAGTIIKQELPKRYIPTRSDVVDVLKRSYEFASQWDPINHYVKYDVISKDNYYRKNCIKKVIFNPPATVVYWIDGTKTVVKAQDGDMFDKEKGLAMAICKRMLGNKGNYYDIFRKHGADTHCYTINVDSEDGISYNGNGSVSISPNKMREMAGVPPKRTVRGNTEKSDYIIEKIKEFTRDFWMLKVYSELDTEEWVLDIGVMNNDMGKSMRYIINLEEVEWERIDEIIGRVTSSIANELIPSVWEKGV